MNKTKQIVLTGFLFAMSLVLTIVENSFPPLFVSMPAVKFGLSNIVVMFSLFFIQKRQAFTIGILKSVFVFFTRGALAGFLSFSGGMLSLIIMSLILLISKDKVSYLLISIFGSLFHNIGQLLAISLAFTNIYMWAYFPVLFITGILAGIVTSSLLKFVIPAIQKLGLTIMN